MSLKKFGSGTLFIIFMVGCIFGTYYEEILNLIELSIKGLPVVYSIRRGVLYGPFSPIYGMGALALTLVLCKKERPMWKTFLIATFLGGFTEYIISFLQETFIGTISWDYSQRLLNINGRTTIPIMLFWGLLGIIFVKFIYPLLMRCINKIPKKIGEKVVLVLFIIFTFDFMLSMTALFRQHFRSRNMAPLSFIGEFCDSYYPDEVLIKYYPNMIKK